MTFREPWPRHAARILPAALVVAMFGALAEPAPGFGQDVPAALRDAPLLPGDPAQPNGASPPAAEQAMKVIPDSFSDAVGTWDLSLEGSNKRCTLVLASENSSTGRVVRFPAGCRRALPPLARTAGWIFADGGIRLIDKDIRPLLQFAASKDRSSLTAKGEGSATYALVPLQTIGMMPAAPDTVQPPAPDVATTPAVGPAPTASLDTPAPAAPARAPEAPPSATPSSTRGIPGSQPVLPSGALVAQPAVAAAPQVKPTPPQAVAKAAPPPASAQASDGVVPRPGVYALDRFNDKDVCRLELDPSRVAAKGDADALSPARILPGCRDSGIAVFDPVSWRFSNGHMTLKAKRGHAVNLVPTGEGSWRRDPDVGTTFVLRKVER